MKKGPIKSTDIGNTMLQYIYNLDPSLLKKYKNI